MDKKGPPKGPLLFPGQAKAFGARCRLQGCSGSPQTTLPRQPKKQSPLFPVPKALAAGIRDEQFRLDKKNKKRHKIESQLAESIRTLILQYETIRTLIAETIRILLLQYA